MLSALRHSPDLSCSVNSPHLELEANGCSLRSRGVQSQSPSPMELERALGQQHLRLWLRMGKMFERGSTFLLPICTIVAIKQLN
jgi:hypothetical protein